MLNTEMASGTSVPLRSTLLFFGFFVFVSAEQKTITAESGQIVTLPCRAPDSSIPVLIVEWRRPDLGDEYVLLFRDERPYPEEQHPSFKNRVDLQDRQMKDGDVSVIMKNVTFNDAGTYECRVVQRRTKFRKRANLDGDPTCIIYLNVVVPPGPSGGTTEEGGKKDGGKEDGRKEDGGSVGLIVGLSVAALLLVAVVGFVIYRKQKQSQDSNHRPVEKQQVEMSET
ncbi:uncharacterized protein LOC115776576 [Archocentrus centrarchus]|uniref:uncharacterized protein LOC115776576 n=1 Tax=Archocentrus centrarchus TaxID=63155 RepID=UPI0011EA0E7B|nr:uncharacterized protein LOC115776576 [Archocentrus centrarchus]